MSSPLTLRLDLRHYETVVAIVDNESMTAAADHLAVTQSALSHRLADAERRLGVALFARGADRRLTPTGNGVATYQAASRALDELRRLEDSIVATPSVIEATVRIGVGGYEAYHWFPGFLDRMRAERPEIELDLVVVGDSIASVLGSRHVDVVLAPGTPEGDLHLTPLFEDELVVVCGPDHALARGQAVDADALAEETLLTYNALPSPGFEYERFVRPSGVTPRIVRVVRQTSAIVELVAAGVGVSILSRWATHPAVTAGRLATARCGVDGLPITWHSAVRRNDGLAAEVADRLRVYLRDVEPTR
ncbi:MAG: LysR family transcriptional regulator [Actinomycetota bacterium]